MGATVSWGQCLLEFEMRVLVGLMIAGSLSMPLSAKPLVTSSEDNVVRVCIMRNESPARLVSACDAALSQFGISAAQRVELISARGDGYLWMDEFEAAEESYREAIALDPNDTSAWNGLGWTLWEAEGDAPAYEAFETSLGIDVTVQALGGKAATGRRMGSFGGEEARSLLFAALAIDPDYIWAVREVGWSYLDDDMPAHALEHFRTALDIEPDDVNAQYGLGRAHLAIGETEQALEVFNSALAISPSDFPTLVYRIIALRNLDRNAQALREADRLIASHPTLSSGYIERGQALLALGRREDAIDTLAKADLALGPNNAVLYWYADALSSDGRFEEALEVIERGLSLSGVDHSDHLLKSYIALELGRYGVAHDAAEASLATGVDDPWAHYYAAIALVNKGEVDQGLARFEQAVEVGLPTDHVGAFAKELVGAGKYVEAAELRLKY
ncbi:MAG: tetratricopeptide repeat protein [Pseudomonadota bacterium]